MDAVRAFAREGGAVVGVCNGFQILCEAGLLPGALIRNRQLAFVCKRVRIRVETTGSVLTSNCTAGDVLEVPVKHGEGQFVATPQELHRIEGTGLVLFRYCGPHGELEERFNPNGATDAIAGLRNDRGNVVGLMPHPEHAVDPDVGPTGGQPLFGSLLALALETVG
jgi:phosphoribosylformylglycinamidine synthase